MKSVGARFLVPFWLVSVLIAVFVFYQTYETNRRHANDLIGQQAAMVLEFNLAIRDYAAEKIRPSVEKLIDKNTIVPDVMSTSLITRGIFEKVRKKFPDCIMRFASENPRNPNNVANPDELRMIEYFQNNPTAERRTDEIEIGGKRYIAHFTPMRMRDKCIRCHGNPEDAPSELIRRYGSKASFNRKVGDVAGVDTVAVPVEAIDLTLASEMRKQSIILAVGLAVLFGSILAAFRFFFSKRLEFMAQHLTNIADRPESAWMAPVKVTGNDEISTVGKAFNKLLDQLRTTHASLEMRVDRRTEELREANERLQSELIERRKAEVDRMRLATAIEQVAEGIMIADANWIIQYANPAFERITGFDKSEIVGRHARVIRNEAGVKDFYSRVGGNPEQGEMWAGRVPARKKDGALYEVEVVTSPVRDETGRIINYISIRRDVTHESRLERELRQSQKMESIGTLAGGIAHDFNNILTAIIGYTEMALTRSDRDAILRRHLDQVLKSSFRAKDLVRQILSFSRKTEHELKPVQVGVIIDEILKLLRSSLPATIEIRRDIGVNSGADIVLADPTQLHQVLMNLCTNAAHAMHPDGGALSVGLMEADGVRVSLEHPDLKEGSYICLTVGDTGQGIDSAILDRIFDPYFTTKKHGEGTGLGLSMVQGIVKSHGGAITVQSNPGGGAVFHVYLPRLTETEAVESARAATLPAGKERILFVDDEQTLADLAEEMLGELGYRVNTQTSSLKAIELFRSRPHDFDLIVTDLTMPGVTGAALAREAAAIRADIPVILCSGFSDQVDEKQDMEAGIHDFILKPYELATLAGTIRKVLDRN